MADGIAVTGAHSFLGARLLRRLAAVHERRLLVLDIAPPPQALGVRFHELDLTQPAADQHLLEIFQQEGIARVLHMAFFTDPQRDAAQAHELESIGTLHVFAAAAAAGVRQVLMRSFTAVYGARGQNPNFLDESSPLPARAPLAWVRDKIEAEQHAAGFAQRYPQLAVGVLRTAPLLGAGLRTFYTRILDNRLVPVLMGYDPLVQLLHPEDALAAFEQALQAEARGAFNVVPRRPIPLRTALILAGKVPWPVPHPLAYLAADALWSTGIGGAPSGFVDYVRYLCVADGHKARHELGFGARYDSREALQDYVRYRYPDRSASRAEVRP